ncbi:MAG: ComEC/Rec2 family competence protein [Pseudomonadales bacterium]|nr:ComEC/Rec2 family competence protein [Pseudomonadales bacterium]
MAWGGAKLREEDRRHYAPLGEGAPPLPTGDPLGQGSMAFLGGAALALLFGPAWVPAWGAAAVLLAGLWALLRPLAPWLLGGVVAGLLLTGAQLEAVRAHRLASVAYLEGEAVLRLRAVQGWPARHAQADVIAWRRADPALRPVQRISIAFYAPLPLKAGATWRMTLRLRAPKGDPNLGRPDPERTRFAAGVHAVGYARGLALALTPPAPTLMERLRARLGDALAPLSPGPRAVFTALLLGQAEPPDALPWDRLALLGGIHLFVVSGFHLGLVFAALRLLMTALTPGVPGRLLTVPLALGVGLYAAITGGGLPVQRAALAVLVLLTALTLGRGPRPGRGLGFAALVLCLAGPGALLSPGAALSFFAVLVLLWPGGGGLGLGALVALQFRLALAMAPLLAAFFGWMPAYGALLNLLLSPLVGGVLLPLGAALLCLSLAGVSFAIPTLEALGQGLLALLAWLAGPGGRAVPLEAGSSLALALATLLALGALAPGLPRLRLAAALLAVALLLPPPAPPAKHFRLTVFAVGQGSAALVEADGRTLLVDTGPRYGAEGGSAFSVRVAPALRALGVRRLDRVLVSHGDSDHAGGLAALQAAFPEAEILGGPGALACNARRTWRWGDVHFTVIHPPPGAQGGQGNARSCVLKVSAGGRRALLLADVPRSVERRLAADLAVQDLVVAAHHGSNGSSARVLAKRTAPRFVVFSAAEPSPFGHPHQDVLARWAAVGARAVSTGKEGMVRWDSRWPKRLRCARGAAWWRASAVGACGAEAPRSGAPQNATPSSVGLK